ncbi:MAG: hypothetical protein IJ292_05535 [Clostridia bacterium]|nr:hypothetical protein [Clostridia bacterium]
MANVTGEKYVIKDNGVVFGLTDICRIGLVKRSGDEFSTYVKNVNLETLPEFAAVRFESQGVSAVYINGEFITASPGKYYNRVVYIEFTSKLKKGDNEIKIVLGGSYYQSSNETIFQRCGAQFSYVSAEFEFVNDENRQTLKTDESWECISDDGQNKPTNFSEVTKAEYERFWLCAALIPEYAPINVPQKVLDTVGEGYAKYVATPWQEYAYPQSVCSTNMKEENGHLVSDGDSSYVTYDFGRTYVGFLTFECTAEEDGVVEFFFDYSEVIEDFEFTNHHAGRVRMLSFKQPLKKGKNEIFLIRRRAFRYLKINLNCKAEIVNVGLKLCMTPSKQLGYFHCDDDMFNKMWEVGKYTLHINKHQEFESCPRNEMKFFTGDGVVDGLVDYYAFGDPSVVLSSLSLTEPGISSGLRTHKLDRNVSLGDYSGWRIIVAYNQYLYFGDKYFVEQYYDEFVSCINWLIEQMNSSYLIYQYPEFSDQYYSMRGVVEFTCSTDRLGEKPYYNAVFYKSLLCMAEFAEIVGDERGKVWAEIAENVYKSFNERLWSEEKKAYVDTYDTSYIPQEGNALAILFGLANAERTELIKEMLCENLWSDYGSTVLSKYLQHTRGGNATVSPLMNMYEAEARFKTGDAEGAVELIRRCWGMQLKKGAGTFWEFSPNHPERRSGQPAHAWSSGVTYLLSAYVLGIRPLKPGYEEVCFEPYCAFDNFEGVVPTCKGLVGVKYRTENGEKQFELAIPQGMKVNTVVPDNAKLTVIEY